MISTGYLKGISLRTRSHRFERVRPNGEPGVSQRNPMLITVLENLKTLKVYFMTTYVKVTGHCH